MDLIDGAQIACKIENEVRKRAYGHKIGVATILKEGDNASSLYARLKEKACMRVGFSCLTKSFSSVTPANEIIEAVTSFNHNSSVHGIMVQQPLPSINYKQVVSAIDPEKDVEGIHPINLGSTLLGTEHLVPCTPLAVMRILEHKDIEIQGKHAVIVNHSPIVGKPLAILLLNRNATVTVCHVHTKCLESYTKRADILVTGAGVKDLITANHIKPGAIVIDVAVIPNENGISGDVKTEEVIKVPGFLTPVPGGVGPVTIACMLENVLDAAGL